MFEITLIGITSIICCTVLKIYLTKVRYDDLNARRTGHKYWIRMQNEMSFVNGKLGRIDTLEQENEALKKEITEIKAKLNAVVLRFGI